MADDLGLTVALLGTLPRSPAAALMLQAGIIDDVAVAVMSILPTDIAGARSLGPVRGHRALSVRLHRGRRAAPGLTRRRRRDCAGRYWGTFDSNCRVNVCNGTAPRRAGGSRHPPAGERPQAMRGRMDCCASCRPECLRPARWPPGANTNDEAAPYRELTNPTRELADAGLAAHEQNRFRCLVVTV